MTALWHASPNFGPRRNGLTPSLIVLHYTAMADATAALHRLCDPQVEVSAHYLIGNTGTIWQMVDEDQRAWHAGAGEWAGQDDINSRSIGIELDNRGDHPFSEPQMAALERLLADIMTRHAIAPASVIGHSDMAPGRKCDPGPKFDWTRLALAGLAAHTGQGPDTPPDADSFCRLAQKAGFTAKVSDTDLLDAIRLRLRPWAKGALCHADMQAVAGAAGNNTQTS